MIQFLSSLGSSHESRVEADTLQDCPQLGTTPLSFLPLSIPISSGAHWLPALHTLRNQTLHNPQAAQEFPAGNSCSSAGFARSKLSRSKEDEVGVAAKGVVGFLRAMCRERGCVCVCEGSEAVQWSYNDSQHLGNQSGNREFRYLFMVLL